MALSNIANISLQKSVLIDFDCFIDTDVGLIRLIKEQYLDSSVFNIELFKLNIFSIIDILYNRKDVNPLYSFSIKEDKELLDNYYLEFLSKKKEDILKLSVTTDIKQLILFFLKEKNIDISFLVKDVEEASVLLGQEELKGCKIIFEKDETDYSKYDQFYFKYINEDRLNKFIFPYKTYYFSTSKINLNQDNSDIIDIPLIDKIIINRGEIQIIDLYNMEIINKGKEIKND